MVGTRNNAPDPVDPGEEQQHPANETPEQARARAKAVAAKAKAEAAKVSPNERRGTAAVAAAVFILFAITVVGFHEIARVSANDLGVSRRC